MSALRVAAIVPARNESERIARTVRALRAIPEVGEVIVVDDASEDPTMAVASGAGAQVFRLRRRLGKGGALAFGIARTDAPVLLFVDGDLAESAAGARALLAPVLAGEADMTIARPPDGRPSGFGLVEGFARRGIEMLTGACMARPLSGQRALRREVLDRASIAARFGVEVGLTVDALRSGFRVVEVPVEVEHARTGRDLRGFLHRARQGLDVAAALGARALRRPRRAR